MSRIPSARPMQNLRHGWSLFRNRRTLWQMLREVLKGSYKMSVLTVVIFVLAIAYVLSPIDLIPDWIPVVGWVDDGFVIYLLLKRLHKETQRYTRFKVMERKGR